MKMMQRMERNQKKRKSKKSVFNKQWLKMIDYEHFLEEYKSGPSQSVFSQMKHLENDKWNCMTTELSSSSRTEDTVECYSTLC
jgi:hypothetical protein